MNTIDHNDNLIEFLSKMPERYNFNTEYLASDILSVYYMAPFENVKKIFLHENGGIQPRNNVQGSFIDLSYSNIQSKRHKLLNLLGNGLLISVKPHDCINFFINPLNNTYYQFRRNSYIKEFANNSKYSGNDFRVLILEIDLEKLLRLPGICWSITDRNIAIGGYTDSYKLEVYKNYPWSKIYSVSDNSIKRSNTSKDNANPHQSAEFIAYAGGQIWNNIPNKLIRKIITYDDCGENIANRLGVSNGIAIKRLKCEAQNVYVLNDPLHHDKGMLKTLSYLAQKGIPQQIISSSLNDLQRKARKIVPKLRNCFDKEEIAMGIHGVKHIVRVMFWVLCLAKVFNVSTNDAETAILAAFIHDLSRVNNDRNDKVHGKLAATKHKKLIKPYLTPARLESCLCAVEYHCINNEPDDSDNVYKLLKDADAMDRGRFAHPIDRRYTNMNGLDVELLKMKKQGDNNVAIDKELKQQLGWLAYRLHKIHEYVNLSDIPYRNLKYCVLASFKALEKYANLDEAKLKIVRSLIKDLVGQETPFLSQNASRPWIPLNKRA